MNRRRARVWIAFAIAIATCAAYARLPRNGWITLDDETYLLRNVPIQKGFTPEGIAYAFRTTDSGNWQPLAWFSHMFDVEMHGWEAGGHHLTSILLHAANAAILFLVLESLTGALWASAFAGLIFGVHPVQVEAVAWIFQRKTLLATLFWFLTLGAYMRYARRPSPGRYALVAITFGFGLMSKPMLVTVPFVLLLLDVWPLRRLKPAAPAAPAPGKRREVPKPAVTGATIGRLLAEKAPLLALSLAAILITLSGQESAMAGIDSLPLSIRIANALCAYVAYLEKFLWPFGLAFFYPYPDDAALAGRAAVSLVVLILVTALVFRWRRAHPHLLVGWLWYLGTLVPVIGLVQVGSQSMADRYLYGPIVGLLLMVCWSVPPLVAAAPARHRALAAVAASLALLFAARTVAQVDLWGDNIRLYTQTLRFTHANFMGHRFLADALHEAGRDREAIREYEMALRLNPGYADAHRNLAVVLVKEKRYAQAVDHFREALKRRPQDSEVRASLGAALASLGRNDEAAREYAGAIAPGRESALGHYNLAGVLAGQGRIDEAEEHYRAAIRLDPSLYPARYNLAVLMIRKSKFDEAEAQLREAIRLSPDLAAAHYNLGNLLARQGRYADALPAFKEAVRLRPGEPEWRLRLSRVEAILSRGH